MWKYLAYVLMAVVILECCNAQMTTTTTTTAAPSTSVNTSQVVNISVPTGRLLGLLSFLTSVSNRFGGGFVGRCFGAARKLKLLIPFFLYKLGVITTTLGFLTLFTLKGLVIGIILLILNAGGWLAKLGFAKGYQYGQHSGWSGGHSHIYGWQKSQPPVHIHVHKDRNDIHHDGHISYRSSPSYSSSSPYDSYSSDIGEDVTRDSYGGHNLRSSSYPYSRKQSKGGSGTDYDPAGGFSGGSWTERISKGFSVNDILGGQLKQSGHSLTYPRRVMTSSVIATTESSSLIR